MTVLVTKAYMQFDGDSVPSTSLEGRRVGDEIEQSGAYHRSGQPGGPGCAVAVLAISLRGADGDPVDAELPDAGERASELELLRTVASRLGAQWGQDELGWWAAVPRR